MNTRHPQAAARSGPASVIDQHDAIRRRAEEIYIRNGRISGRDMENWVQAEQEILRESIQEAGRSKAIVVKVNGVQYVGEYDPETSGGYTPGELMKGVAIPVRFVGDKMFVKRPNGQELETTIVKRVG